MEFFVFPLAVTVEKSVPPYPTKGAKKRLEQIENMKHAGGCLKV